MLQAAAARNQEASARQLVARYHHLGGAPQMWMAATLVSMHTRSRNLHAALAVKAEVVEVHGLVPNRCET